MDERCLICYMIRITFLIILLFLLASIAAIAQSPSSNSEGRVRFTRGYYDSMRVVREAFYASMAKEQLIELEMNNRKDTIRSVSLSENYISNIPEFLALCIIGANIEETLDSIKNMRPCSGPVWRT